MLSQARLTDTQGGAEQSCEESWVLGFDFFFLNKQVGQLATA